MKQSDNKIPVTQISTPSNKMPKAKPRLSKKQSQWAWFIGLYLTGLVTITLIAKLIKWGMGI